MNFVFAQAVGRESCIRPNNGGNLCDHKDRPYAGAASAGIVSRVAAAASLFYAAGVRKDSFFKNVWAD
jgi:hypothetical protein